MNDKSIIIYLSFKLNTKDTQCKNPDIFHANFISRYIATNKNKFNLYSNYNSHHQQILIIYNFNYTKLIKILIIRAEQILT